MTRRDYELIAASVNRTRMASALIPRKAERNAALRAVQLVAIDLAATLAHDNPRFHKGRFMSACGFFYSQEELRAKGFAVADGIETRALPLIRAGMSRQAAIEKTIEEMAG